MHGAVEELSNTLGINELQLSEWKNAILCYIDFQINKYKNKFEHQKCKPILNNTTVKEAMEKTPTRLCSYPN